MELDPKINTDLILPREAEPSELRRRLNALKDPETGHIMVTPSQAKELLLDRLVLEHRRMAEQGLPPDVNLAPSFWSSPLIEALDVARKIQGQEIIDFTQVLETLKEEKDPDRRKNTTI